MRKLSHTDREWSSRYIVEQKKQGEDKHDSMLATVFLKRETRRIDMQFICMCIKYLWKDT